MALSRLILILSSLKKSCGAHVKPTATDEKNLAIIDSLMSTDWSVRNFCGTIGQQHPWILHGEVCRAIWTLLPRLLEYLGFLTTATTKPLLTPSQRTGTWLESCVSISWGNRAQELFLFGWLGSWILWFHVSSPTLIPLDQVLWAWAPIKNVRGSEISLYVLVI